ncbi:MAG: GWxTD domain-containing protein [Thermoanaerobaculia bacterium]
MNMTLALVLAAVAALSPNHKEWGNGPAQWIMTAEEQRAWRNVDNDADAVKFIDLFWARRDPSPDTPVNEFKREFESRVAYSDKAFGEKRKRGAMTDRGRVYITMGAPTTMDGMLGQSSAQMGSSDASTDMSTLGQSGTRYIWVWDKDDARKFDMARIEILFVEDPMTHKVQRDPRKADFGRAGPAAIQKWIVNPDLTEVPVATAPAITPPSQPAPVETVAVPEPAPAPAVATFTAGVSALTILPRGSARDVPWTAQFCSESAETPRLKTMLLIAGPLDGTSTEQRTRQTNAKPERIAALPGCYVLRGTVPAAKLAPGRYKVTVMIDNDATGDVYDVKTELHVD